MIHEVIAVFDFEYVKLGVSNLFGKELAAVSFMLLLHYEYEVCPIQIFA